MSLYPKEIKYELAAMGLPRGPNSNVYFVDPVNGSNTNSGDRWTKPVADIATAYGLCTANQHDVVLYLASSSGVDLTAALTWSKSYTHLVGMCAPTCVGRAYRALICGAQTCARPYTTSLQLGQRGLIHGRPGRCVRSIARIAVMPWLLRN